MVLMRLCKCACSPESWLLADVTNIKFSCAGSYNRKMGNFCVVKFLRSLQVKLHVHCSLIMNRSGERSAVTQ